MFGAIEAGGTKFVCAVGSDPADLRIAQLRTTSPQVTIAQAIDFLRSSSGGKLQAVGIGSFVRGGDEDVRVQPRLHVLFLLTNST